MVSICVECRHYGQSGAFDCHNTDLPISDFVYGARFCAVLNAKGDCKGFKAKPQTYSIYESKEDEDLANTANGSPWEPGNSCVEHKP